MTHITLFVILAIFFLPTIALAKDYIVGDKYGCTVGYDYRAWTKGKQFLVGDRLIFRHRVGFHNVFEVNETGFQYCTVPPANEAFNSGYDIIPLATPGRKWYLCGAGAGAHCSIGGQKLFIDVRRQSVPLIAPMPQYIVPSLAPEAIKTSVELDFTPISAPSPAY